MKRSNFRQAICISMSWLALSACQSQNEPLREWKAEDHGEPKVDDGARQAMDDAPQEQGGVGRAAAALYNVSCASCHGREGKGDGPGRPPAAQMPDFSSVEYQKSRSDEQIAQAIRDGKNMMPPFGKQVNPQGITALVAHVRSLSASPAPPVTPTPTVPAAP